MKKTLIVCGLILGIFSQPLQAENYNISDVRVVGNELIDTDAILLNLQSKPGIVAESTVKEDLRTLYKMGFFDRAEVSLSSGGQVLVFNVVEKPTARKILIKGNEDVAMTDLVDVLKLDQNRFVDQHILQGLNKNAESFYQSKGFYDVKIAFASEKVSDSQVDVTFTIDEGQSYKIREIKLAGLNQADQDEILNQVQTLRYKWWNSWLFGTGRLNQEMLENDRLIIQQNLLDYGFIDAKVGPPVINKEDDGLYISFAVEEGAEYTIGNINVTGDLIDQSPEETLADIDIESEDVFSASKVRADTFVIADKFGDRGYAFANVVPDTRIDRKNSRVDVIFKVDQGKPVTINEIKITGNNKTYDNVIRREFKLNEKDLYSTSKVKRAETMLKRSGYFEDVSVATEASKETDKVDLNVNVKEGPTGSFSVGAGYSTADGMILSTSLSERNFFGTGRRLTLGADIGEERENLMLGIDDPRFLDSYWAVGADASRSMRQFDDFDRTLTGGGASVGYPLEEIFGAWSEDINFRLRYQYVDALIDDVDPLDAAQLVIDSEGTTSASGMVPTIIRNTIDNPMNPTRGSRQVLSLELNGLGGAEEFYLAEFRNTWYQPLFKLSNDDVVFSWRFNVGYGENYTGDEPFPLFKRYFPGGINSVRGYQNRTLGPADENGNEYGGNKELVNNLELIFPLIASAGLKGVVFYDAGDAFDDEESITFSDLRMAYGYGLRWMSPIGPLRIEIGHPIDRETDEDSMVTMFSFGAPL